MILAIDIGNTTATFGLFEGGEFFSKFVIPTNREQTSDELHSSVLKDLKPGITNVIVSSVVPELENSIREFSVKFIGTVPVFVDHTFDFGFSIKYFPPESCGADRLVAAFAASVKYGKPCIVCDLGTATTIEVVNSKNEYTGGVIVPGIKTLADSLFEKTSKLPKVEIKKPAAVIGNTTINSIRSGVFYGYIGLIDGLIDRIVTEMNETPVIIATGGYSGIIAESSAFIEIVDRDLILEGLLMIQQNLLTSRKN